MLGKLNNCVLKPDIFPGLQHFYPTAFAMASPMLPRGRRSHAMNKTKRCLLHLRCIARKGMRGQDCQWHWQHLLRELGRGIYSEEERQGVFHP